MNKTFRKAPSMRHSKGKLDPIQAPRAMMQSSLGYQLLCNASIPSSMIFLERAPHAT